MEFYVLGFQKTTYGRIIASDFSPPASVIFYNARHLNATRYTKQTYRRPRMAMGGRLVGNSDKNSDNK